MGFDCTKMFNMNILEYLYFWPKIKVSCEFRTNSVPKNFALVLVPHNQQHIDKKFFHSATLSLGAALMGVSVENFTTDHLRSLNLTLQTSDEVKANK